ncbi:hypothetical protein AZ78_3545 [Lysobacter capsici AZ78]|uniref:Uncharacterized protein n=1 Tax=Lysobacter capsici AZ78 TaxID=1444315 RepID=A0A125MNA8_9GAMM|nr:hypothetical protein AZ78_3545 [Lysobacter capsici AZ78]
MEFVHCASFERPWGRTPPTAGGRCPTARVFDAREPAASSLLRVAPSPCVAIQIPPWPERSAPGHDPVRMHPARLRANGGPEFLLVC